MAVPTPSIRTLAFLAAQALIGRVEDPGATEVSVPPPGTAAGHVMEQVLAGAMDAKDAEIERLHRKIDGLEVRLEVENVKARLLILLMQHRGRAPFGFGDEHGAAARTPAEAEKSYACRRALMAALHPPNAASVNETQWGLSASLERIYMQQNQHPLEMIQKLREAANGQIGRATEELVALYGAERTKQRRQRQAQRRQAQQRPAKRARVEE